MGVGGRPILLRADIGVKSNRVLSGRAVPTRKEIICKSSGEGVRGKLTSRC